MSDLDVLRELVGQFRPPGYDDLVAVSRKRRRRSAVGAAAGALVVVLGVGLAGAAVTGGQRADAPVQDPSPTPTETSSTSEEWTPERFRAEGSPDVLIPPTESGLTAIQYVACEGTCQGELRDRALEVSQNGQSAVFEVRGLEVSFAPVWVTVFDEDSVLVQDAENGRPEGPVRYRLLQADGPAVQLQMVEDPAPAVPGPRVFVIDPYSAWSRGSAGPDDHQDIYLVDDLAGTLRPLEVPEGIASWGPNVDEFLWGANGCRVTWQQPDGSFDQHDLDCRNPGLTDVPTDYWDYLDDWAAPGRMVLLEHSPDGVPLVLHASLDYGATWERIEVEDRNWDGTIAQTGEAIADVLESLG